MTPPDIQAFRHEHAFLGAAQERHERRTRLVIALTAVMMVVEVTAGLIFGSMALLADGWHMASHAAALSLTALGYFLARRHAENPRFCFGTGKVGDLAGFVSALLLAFIAALMAYESVVRLFSPVRIAFNEAILVAVVGLVVNLVSALMLREDRPHEHGEAGAHPDHDRQHHTDHNLKSAYFHVLADALTSVLAILALTTGKYLGWVWMDPVMGIVGSLVIARWSWGLLSDTGRTLLDVNPYPELAEDIRRTVESSDGDRVADLHLWRLGPGHLGAIVSIVSETPQPAKHYKQMLSQHHQISHLTVEVHPLRAGDEPV